MKLFILFCSLIFPMNVVAATFEQHVHNYYKPTWEAVQKHIGGPVAKELAKVAILRQATEDGLNRPPDYSAVGMVPGGLNTEVMNLLQLKPQRITATDGQGCYALREEQANVKSATAIALLLDRYVYKFNFSERERKLWDDYKRVSREIVTDQAAEKDIEWFGQNKPALFKLMHKANRIYGPNSEAIKRLTEQLDLVFKFRQ